MRTWIAALALLLPGLALAQDTPKPQPTPKPSAPAKPAKPKFDWTSVARISVEADQTLDKKKQTPNSLQYYLWERLNHFRLRVDSLKKVGSPRFDKYIDRVTRWWEKKSPTKNHPVKLKLIVSQHTTYNASKFYGEAQAHNFRGTIKAQLQSPDGEVLATWAFDHSWGKLIRSGMSKSQVNALYNQMAHTALAMAILSHEAVHSKLTPANQKKADTWVRTEKAKLMKVIKGSTKAIQNSDFAKFVRKIPVKEAAKDSK